MELGTGMSRMTLSSIALATVVSAGCGGGGLNFWLYPAPHLPEAEEAVFFAYESHGLRAIDGEDVGSKCWDDQRRPEGYSAPDIGCRLHLEPGEHTVAVHPSSTSRETVTLTFTAVAGKVYGVDRSGCSTSTLTREARVQTCNMQIKEVGEIAPGGF